MELFMSTKSLLDEKIIYHVLDAKGMGLHQKLLDNVFDNEEIDKDAIKNVCAKLHVSLSDRIDQTVDLLGMSKRSFIEAALITALDRASSIIEEYGLLDSLAEDAALLNRGA